MENKENQEQVNIQINTNEEGKKIIEETYNLYTSQKVQVDDIKRPLKNGTSPLVSKGTGELKLAKPEYKDISSVDNLNSDLQKQVKDAMSGDNKEKIQAAMKEIELYQDKFFIEDANIFTDLKKSEKLAVEKKISEMHVAKEITEINVSAIISCIGNIKTKKNR